MSLVHRVRTMGQAGLDTLGGRLGVRGASIRGKVTWAFAGVVALLVPQIVLTVFYLLSLFNHGDRVVHLADTVREVARVTARAEDLLPERAPRTDDEFARALGDVQRVSTSLASAAERVSPLRDSVPEAIAPLDDVARAGQELQALAPLIREVADHTLHAPPPSAPGLATVSGALGDLAERLVTWAKLEEDRSPVPPAERAAWLADFSVRVLGYLVGELAAGQTQAGLAPPPFERHDLRVSHAKRRVLDLLARAETALTAGGASAGAAIREDVDEANRFLVTLVLITLVYLSVVAMVLPGRLVRPLEHLRSVMQRAGRGRLDVRAEARGGHEIAAVSGALNGLLERLQAFDDLKRDRIALDRRRVDALVEGVDDPVAVLDTHQRLDLTNEAFRRWFGLEPRDLGRPLADALHPDEGARALAEALDQSLRSGRPIEGLQLDLGGSAPCRSALLTVRVGHDRAGRTAFATVWLKPAGAAGSAGAPVPPNGASEAAPHAPGTLSRKDA